MGLREAIRWLKGRPADVRGRGAMDRKEALRLLRSGPDGVREWNRRRKPDRGMPLPEMLDLSGADLSRKDLSDADLRRTVLASAHLQEAILHRADLRGGILNGADLGRADVREALLNGADL